jgi:biopolymer transport protein ExbD
MVIPSPRTRRRARIEIIPLIDIIFFLLATFMIVSMSMIKNQGLSVHLPVAASGVPQDRNNVVTVTVSETGDYSWDKQAIAPDDLSPRLEQLKQSQPDAKLIINGDNRVQLQRVITVLDDAQKVGLSKVIIQTTAHPQ